MNLEELKAAREECQKYGSNGPTTRLVIALADAEIARLERAAAPGYAGKPIYTEDAVQVFRDEASNLRGQITTLTAKLAATETELGQAKAGNIDYFSKLKAAEEDRDVAREDATSWKDRYTEAAERADRNELKYDAAEERATTAESCATKAEADYKAGLVEGGDAKHWRANYAYTLDKLGVMLQRATKAEEIAKRLRKAWHWTHFVAMSAATNAYDAEYGAPK